ncbi:hypothetical protein [Rickettsia oklahomensis]|uniref:Uncharacterized protein n=1 Tax=Rickettsia oklahomensis TaxID=3141789 RepID=A0AAU7BYV5_9RICK
MLTTSLCRKNATLIQQYKAIKNGSYGLDTLYTKKTAVNLVKLIILGHEGQVKEILEIKKCDFRIIGLVS